MLTGMQANGTRDEKSRPASCINWKKDWLGSVG